MVELMCNGTFEDKDPNEAMEYLDLLAENAQNWDTTSIYEAPMIVHLCLFSRNASMNKPML